MSVLLPTIRPERIGRVLVNLLAQAEDLPCEIVVVADFDGEAPVTRWIRRARQGVVDAVCAAYAAAQGDVMFLTNDETVHQPGCLKALHDAAHTRPDVLWMPLHHPPFNFVYYGKVFAAFPCAHRDLITRLGGLLDPVYRGFYADPDLSMRAHAAGVSVEVAAGASIEHHNAADKSAAWDAYFLADRATFRSRWDHLGVFCDP